MNKTSLAVNELCIAVKSLIAAVHDTNPNSIARVQLMNCDLAANRAINLIDDVLSVKPIIVEVPPPAQLGEMMSASFDAASSESSESSDTIGSD